MRWFLNRKSILTLELLGLFLIALVLVYLAVNSPALYQRLKYKTEYGTSNLSSLEESLILEAKPPLAELRENRLVIPKIEVEVPIIFSESTEEKEIMENLKNGVIHYPDTALPGEEGNCVITGHSSDFWWRKGDYKTVFALLNELEISDLVIVYYDQEKFIYKVTGKDIVSSNNIDILSQNKKEPLTESVGPTLTLFTCWPLGTDLRRLVVKAELVD